MELVVKHHQIDQVAVVVVQELQEQIIQVKLLDQEVMELTLVIHSLDQQHLLMEVQDQFQVQDILLAVEVQALKALHL